MSHWAARAAPEEDPSAVSRTGLRRAVLGRGDVLEAMAESRPYEALLVRGTYGSSAALVVLRLPRPRGRSAYSAQAAPEVFVASTTLERVAWNNSHTITRRCRQTSKQFRRRGSGRRSRFSTPWSIQTLLRHDLIETLPHGICAVGDRHRQALRLFGRQLSLSGWTPQSKNRLEDRVTIITYSRAGGCQALCVRRPDRRGIDRRRRLAADVSSREGNESPAVAGAFLDPVDKPETRQRGPDRERGDARRPSDARLVDYLLSFCRIERRSGAGRTGASA